jgi:CubicO group peptidase (beta-lactamase class C family)
MLALTDGRLSLDDPVCKYVPQWKEDPQKKIITVRQLATHTSGLEDAEAEKRDVPHNKLTGWKGEFWKTLEPPRDPFTLSRDEARVVFKPGTKFPPGDDAGYSNPGYAMLAYTIAASYRGTPYADLRVLLRDRLMRPIGAGDEEWSVGYKRTFNVDGLPLMATWGGGAYTARAVARVARLLLRNGDWEGKQLLARDSIHQVKPQGPVAPWLRPLPAGSFCGAGAGMQLMIVVPSLDLLAVRNGKDLAENDSDWKSLSPVLFEPLMNAIEK